MTDLVFGSDGFTDFDKLISERAVKEFFRNEKRNDAIILTNFPQYTLEHIVDMAAGDYRRLVDAAISVQAHKDIMSLMIAVSAQDSKLAKRLFASLEQLASS